MITSSSSVFVFDAITKTHRLGFVSKTFYFYRQNPSSTTNTVNLKLPEHRLTQFREFYRLAETTGYPEACRKRIRIRIAFTCASVAYSIAVAEGRYYKKNPPEDGKASGFRDRLLRLRRFLREPVVKESLRVITFGHKRSDIKFLLIKHRLVVLLYIYMKLVP